MATKRWPKVSAPRKGLPLKDAFRAAPELTNIAGKGLKQLGGRAWLKK